MPNNDGIKIVNHIKINRDELIKRYKNDSSLNDILCIFDKIRDNKLKNIERRLKNYPESKILEEEKKEYENSIDIAELFYDYTGLLGTRGIPLDKNDDGSITDNEIKLFLEHNSIGKELGTNFAAFKKFLTIFSEKELSETEKYAAKNNISKELATTLMSRYVDFNDVRIVKSQSGETLYQIGTDNQQWIFNSNGSCIEEVETLSDSYFEIDDSRDSYDRCHSTRIDHDNWRNELVNSETGLKQTSYYNSETSTETKRITQTKDMKIEQSFENGKLRLDKLQLHDEFGGLINVSLNYDENGQLSNVDVNTTAGKKKVQLEGRDNIIPYDEYEPTDLPELSERSLSELINMINKGNIAHNDFDMKFENGEVKFIPRLSKKVEDTKKGCDKYEDIKLPQFMENKMINLMKKGFKLGTDFNINPKEEGKFEIEYISSEILDYEYNYKSETYDKNGNMIQRRLNHGNGVEEKVNYDKNGTIIDGDIIDWNIQEGFSFNNEEERQLILNKVLRNNSVQNYNKYDASNTPAANLIPKIERTVVNESFFKEKINGVNYEVKIDDNQLKIKKGNKKELSIDISNLNLKFVKKYLMQVNAGTLYHLAKSKTILKQTKLSVNGYYEPKTNTMYIAKQITDINEFVRVITHESGHMFDSKDDKEYAIRFIKDMMKNPSPDDFGKTLGELLDKYGTRQMQSTLDEKLNSSVNKVLEKAFNVKINIARHKDIMAASAIKAHILENYLQDYDINELYGIHSIEEFFAEAYSLLTTGHCKSERLLCNYLSEPLKLVKERIEREE